MRNFCKLPKVIFFGDSLTERGWSYDGGWLAMVADSLVRRVDVIGRGFSGYTTRICRPLLNDLYPDKASVKNCRFFTIFLGANDASSGSQHVPIDEYKANLAAMVMHLKELEITLDRILLISVPPVDEARYNALQLAKDMSPVRQLKCCQLYTQACKEVASECGVGFINLYNAMIAQQNWHEFFNDGLHFSRKGSEFLANILKLIFDERLADCTVQLPDWKTVNMEDPQSTLQAYKDGLKNDH
ncbi:hypothetical protein P879_03109 [Paragonimus westermani]|uniref:SGNH hydrolase-type esterase domain-containing protein n=1 Tax=Paragonimus westermani TaxID=34504 RepID=A0A8T0DVH4_9TREM|nr:hypothetical protein P879_03109 [Paragonimus westermani]